MWTTTNGTEMWIDLSALAARLSRTDGDGHHWDEEDARRWLQRTGQVPVAGGGGTAARPDGARTPELLRRAG